MNPNTSVAKTGRNSLHWFLRYGVHKVFGTHRLTDGHTRKQNASDTEGFCWQRHKICKAHNVSAQAESEVHCKAKLPRSRPLKQRQGHRRKAKVTTKPADRVKAEVYRPMWPNFGKISYNSYENIDIVALTFDLLTQKTGNSGIRWSTNIRGQHKNDEINLNCWQNIQLTNQLRIRSIKLLEASAAPAAAAIMRSQLTTLRYQALTLSRC